MFKEKIDRINQLAKKAKEEGLTSAELEEQKKLRDEYIAAYRESLREQLLSIKVVDIEGNDITPQKLKDAKKNRTHLN